MAFCIVGDQDQMLFRWCGAKPEIMTDEIQEYFPDLLSFKLEVNYRSTVEIVDASKRSIAYNYADRGGPYSQEVFKNSSARPEAATGDPISFQMYSTQEEEADGVVETIVALIESGERTAGDFFIGARTRSQLGYIEGALTKRGLKYVNLAGGCFWSSKHVQDVLAYVRLANNAADDEAFKRVYNIASRWFVAPFGSNKGHYINHRYLGRAFMDSVQSSYMNIGYAKWTQRAGVDDLRSFVEDTRVALAGGVSEAIEFVVENCYRQWLAADEGLLNLDESENGKLEDLKVVAAIAARFDSADAFFNYVTEVEKAAQDIKNGDHTDYIVISTIHRLKGKERPVVFGIGICEGIDQKGRAIGLLPHTFSMTAPPNFGVLPTGGMSRIEDERCAFFVLISRAEEQVYLSGFHFFRDSVLEPSRFVREINLLKTETEIEEGDL